MPPFLRLVLVVVAILLGLYLVIVVLLFALQDRLIFPGARSGGRVGPLPAEPPPGVKTEWLTLGDGKRIRAAIGQPVKPSGVIVFFVGNGEDVWSCIERARELVVCGLLAVVPEYPGYGESEGTLGVESFMRAAEAAADHARGLARQNELPFLVGGVSLGSCPAMHVAARGDAAKLLLLAPLTTLADASSHHYPWLPIRWLLRHPFDNMAKAAQIRCPTLIVHGDADIVVPYEFGKSLAAAIGGCELVTARGRSHDLGVSMTGPAGDRVRAFLGGTK